MLRRTLDLDLGNSRLKWRYTDGSAREEGALTNSELDRGPLLPEFAVERIRLASVASQEVVDPVLALCRQRWRVEPEVAVVQETCAGVRQGYRDRTRLGVDRWLNVVAAYSQMRSPCVVVSCGTAMTVDLVTAAGEHLGGYIVPGLEMMRRALFSGTHAVKLDELGVAENLAPGRDTQQAVSRGLLLMTRGVINDAVASLSAHDRGGDVPRGVNTPLVIFTGGDGERLLPLVAARGSTNVRYLPNLVLDGLAVALP